MEFAISKVYSTDGTAVGYRQIGSGPGLVILHGGGRASQHYVRLAEALSGAYTVTIPDRRGRGLSGPPGTDYSLQKEIEDLSTVLEKTGARMIFGHSGGGFFALEAALHLPIRKLALYEPAISVRGSLPLDWLPGVEQALARNDPVAAFSLFFKGLRLHWASKLPAWVLSPFVRLMLREAEGQEMVALLPTIIWEAKEIKRLERLGQTFERYRNIPAETLLLAGSQSPEYLRKAVSALAEILPGARCVELAGQGHNAPDENAPEVVAGELDKFFA